VENYGGGEGLVLSGNEFRSFPAMSVWTPARP
jgi:hypothetical protein